MLVMAYIESNDVERVADHVSSFQFHAGDFPHVCSPDHTVLQRMFSCLSRIIEMSWNN